MKYKRLLAFLLAVALVTQSGAALAADIDISDEEITEEIVLDDGDDTGKESMRENDIQEETGASKEEIDSVKIDVSEEERTGENTSNAKIQESSVEEGKQTDEDSSKTLTKDISDEDIQDEKIVVDVIAPEDEECIVTINEPQDLMIVPGENRIDLSWESVSLADSYNVYRAELQEDSEDAVHWIQLGNTKECTYTDENVAMGVVYQYSVSAVSGDLESTHAQADGSCGYTIIGSEKQEETAASNCTSVVMVLDEKDEDSMETPILTKVEGLTAVSFLYNRIKINWNKKKEANGYLLYTKTSKSAKWNLLKKLSATQTSYTHSVSCGSTRYYTVCAYRIVNGSQQLGERNESGVFVKAIPSAPASVSIKKKNATTLTISWNKVGGAMGYRLYRRKKDSDKWTIVKTFTGNTLRYNDTKRVCGVNYSYAVRAYRTVKGSKIWGNYSKAVSGHTTPAKGTLLSIITSATKNAKLAWNRIIYADGYQIARKTGSNGKYMVIGTTTSITFTDKNLTGAGTVYSYRLRPYVTINGKKVYGSWSTGKSYTHYAYKYYINAKKIPETIDLPGIEQLKYGESGQGRPLYAYKIGNGSKHMVLNFAIHGWEDHWKADGYELTLIAVKLLERLSEQETVLEKKGWSIVVIPCANPDGYYNGTTCNGPGRCTTRRYNVSGKLVKGGVDLNRSFPAGFSPKYNARNYTGPHSLMAKEGRALRDLLIQYNNNGKNIYFDVHGWTQQILTNRSGSGKIYKTMHAYFPQNSAGNNGGSGYAAYYARTLGYDACLFEFPRNVTSHRTIVNKGYDTKFINAIWSLIQNY